MFVIRFKSVFNIIFVSHILLYAYPYFEYCIWVIVKDYHEGGLRWLLKFWYRFGYIINCFPIIITITLIITSSIISLVGNIIMILFDEWRIGYCNHSMIFWNDEFSRLSQHYENIDQRWGYDWNYGFNISVTWKFPSVDFNHVNITLKHSLTQSSWCGKFFSNLIYLSTRSMMTLQGNL